MITYITLMYEKYTQMKNDALKEMEYYEIINDVQNYFKAEEKYNYAIAKLGMFKNFFNEIIESENENKR